MDWTSLQSLIMGVVSTLGIGGGTVALLTRNGRRRDKAEADAKVAEAQRLMIGNYEERLKELNDSIHQHNISEREYIARISEQNKALNEKTEQIRNLTEKVWQAEQEINRVQDLLNEANERITSLTEERDNYRNWHCRNGHCTDRVPPNPTLAGQTFPEKIEN